MHLFFINYRIHLIVTTSNAPNLSPDSLWQATHCLFAMQDVILEAIVGGNHTYTTCVHRNNADTKAKVALVASEVTTRLQHHMEGSSRDEPLEADDTWNLDAFDKCPSHTT